jgi:sarcosine oxidase/L-pipecolate oxidase
MKHYSKTSFKPTHPTNRVIIRNSRNLHIAHHEPPPFNYQETRNIINKLKNSKATGIDEINNLHLKHLGPIAIEALTNIYNYSWRHNTIPKTWKIANIIPTLKPGKLPKEPASYRPISLLSCTSKVLEKLIYNKIKNNTPIAPTQHGFRPNHSTSTLLTNLTQQILDGFNQPSPPNRTLLLAIDINKAFDTTPRHQLTQKILNNTFHNNDKK